MKQVLITGGTRGIGLACAKLFMQKGYAVAVTYSKDEQSAAIARALGLRVVKADVSKEEDVKALFDTIGYADVVVNNAGVSLIKLLADTTQEEWDKVFAVNVKGAYLTSRFALKNKMLSKNYGVIVNVSSVWGEVGASMEVAYSASKAALIGFTKALSKEVGYSGVRVNCITPGVIATRMNDCFDEETKKGIVEEIPVGRMGTAEEVACAVLFAVENEYLNGAVIPVNGGYNA